MPTTSIFQKDFEPGAMNTNGVMSWSPDGPSSHNFSSPSPHELPNSRLLSSSGLEKAYKSLRFSDTRRVITIKSRHECLAPGMDLWWTPMDYSGFKQTRINESRSGLDIASFNFQKANDNDVLVDFRILVVSNESVISSALTSNLAAALTSYEEEINRDAVADGGENASKFRVRSSVTQVPHNSKEYALAVQGQNGLLLHNVIVYDNSKRGLKECATGCRYSGSPDNGEREHKQATSYIESQPDSYIVSSMSCGANSDGVNLSPLLLSDAFDAAQVPVGENFLLRKIIKSGSALSYICEEKDKASTVSIAPIRPDVQFSRDLSPRRRRRRRSQKGTTPLCIPLASDRCASFPPSRRSSAPGALVSRQHHYSLLRDHADVVLGQWSSQPLRAHTALDNIDFDSAESLSCSFSSTSSCTTNSTTSVEGNRVLSVDDWVCLFRVSVSRSKDAAPTAPPMVQKVPCRRVSLGLMTSHELDGPLLNFATLEKDSTSSDVTVPPSSPPRAPVPVRSGESLLARSLRGEVV